MQISLVKVDGFALLHYGFPGTGHIKAHDYRRAISQQFTPLDEVL